MPLAMGAVDVWKAYDRIKHIFLMHSFMGKRDLTMFSGHVATVAYRLHL